MKIKLLFKITVSIGLLFAIQANSQETFKPKLGPLQSPLAVPLYSSLDYFKREEAPDFWRLSAFYVPQFNGAACSVASVSMVINALLSQQKLGADDTFLTQEKLLNEVKVENWKARIAPSLSSGLVVNFTLERGVTLDSLGKILDHTTQKYLSKYKPKQIQVDVIHVDTSNEAKLNESLKTVEAILIQNEKAATDFIIANFDQGTYTQDTTAGHISPVGAYDPKAKRVLVFDVDRDYYFPYWVSLETFVKGMGTIDSGAKKSRGFVWLKTQ